MYLIHSHSPSAWCTAWLTNCFLDKGIHEWIKSINDVSYSLSPKHSRWVPCKVLVAVLRDFSLLTLSSTSEVNDFSPNTPHPPSNHLSPSPLSQIILSPQDLLSLSICISSQSQHRPSGWPKFPLSPSAQEPCLFPYILALLPFNNLSGQHLTGYKTTPSPPALGFCTHAGPWQWFSQLQINEGKDEGNVEHKYKYICPRCPWLCFILRLWFSIRIFFFL